MVNPSAKEYKLLNERYKAISGSIIPMEMIPDSETLQGLEDKIKQCEAAGKDLFPQLYNWDFTLKY